MGISEIDQGRVLRVEVLAAEDGARERAVMISGGAAAGPGRRVEVASLQQLMRLLSESNVALLNIVRTQKPRSVAELARMTGRPKASLTQTLRRLEKFGLIAFRPTNGRRKTPEIACDKVRLDVDITATDGDDRTV